MFGSGLSRGHFTIYALLTYGCPALTPSQVGKQLWWYSALKCIARISGTITLQIGTSTTLISLAVIVGVAVS